MWSDPSPLPGWNPSSRGMSEVFGADITEHFLLDNSLKYIVRGHEVAMDVSRLWSNELKNRVILKCIITS